MKKLALFIFVLFLLVGCSNEPSAEKEMVKEIQDNGLTEEQAKNYFVYINSIYLGYVSFDSLDAGIEENKHEISTENYNSVMTPFNTAADMFNKFNTSDKLIDFDDYLLSEQGPSGIMNNMERYDRNIGGMEKGLMVGTFNSYTENLIERIDISDKQKENLYAIYEDVVYTNNSFSEVNEDWKEALSE